MHPLILGITLCFCFSSALLADEQTTASPLAKLKAAKATYTADLAQQAMSLEAAFKDAIAQVATTGDLDAVKVLITERDAFVASKTLPESDAMAAAKAKYQTGVETAAAKLSLAYKETVSSLTKALNFDTATIVQDELKTFEKTGALPTAEIPRTPIVVKDGLSPETAAARTEYRQALAAARADFDAAIATRIQEVATTGDLDAVKELQALREELKTYGQVQSPRDTALRTAEKEFGTATRAAERDLEKAYNAAIAIAKREKNEELARQLTIELDGGISDDGLRWTILFRSSDPSIWNTAHNGEKGFAVPVEQSPEQIRYLRMRRLDKKIAVYLPITNENLTRMHAEGDWGWCGTGKLDWKGHHLGIYKVSSLIKFPAPNRFRGVVGIANRGFDVYLGYGFGHFLKLDSGQGYAWAGRNIKPTFIEIAVTDQELTPTERKLLLK